MWKKLLGSGVFARGSNPLTKTILGVSLIYGQFRAMAVVKGHIAGSWVFPGLVNTADDLRTALQEAIRATNFPGQLVSFLVEDTRLMHNYHLVPQMKQADLDRFLERIAIQEKATEGPVVWRYRRAHQAKERIGLLLDIWPQSLVNEFITVCEDLSLRPVHLLPLSAVFVDQVRMLATSTKKVLLLVTQMAGKVVFVVATGDGKPLFDRFLSSPKDEVLDPERIGREIIRSVLFAQQQLRKQITQVWVMGETEELSAERLQPFVELPILPSPMKPDPSYWIWVGVMLPATHSSNFIPWEVRTAPIRRVVSKFVVGMVVGLGCASITTGGLIEGLLVRERGISSALSPETRALVQEKRDWNLRYQTLADKQVWVKAVMDEEPSPVIGWFLGYLPDILPRGVTLTKVSLAVQEQGWGLELRGEASKDLRLSAKALAVFEQRLMESPYRVNITKSWRDTWVEQLRQGATSSDDQQGRPFLIEGQIL